MNGYSEFSVGRLMAGTGTAQDFNLNGDYYIMYGRRTRNPIAGGLATHVQTAPNPVLSAEQYNPATETRVMATMPPALGRPDTVTVPVSNRLLCLRP